MGSHTGRVWTGACCQLSCSAGVAVGIPSIASAVVQLLQLLLAEDKLPVAYPCASAVVCHDMSCAAPYLKCYVTTRQVLLHGDSSEHKVSRRHSSDGAHIAVATGGLTVHTLMHHSANRHSCKLCPSPTSTVTRCGAPTVSAPRFEWWPLIAQNAASVRIHRVHGNNPNVICYTTV